MKLFVKDKSGKKFKSLSPEKAAHKMQLDPGDLGYAVEEHGRADTDTHSAKVQSNGRFAFK